MRKQPDEYAKIREINAGLVAVDDDNADILDLGKNECAASQMPNSFSATIIASARLPR
jgi:hypothetical protein